MAARPGKARPLVDAQKECTVLDLLDGLINKGVVVRGDVTISVADVDLIYLQLNLLLTAIERLPFLHHRNSSDDNYPHPDHGPEKPAKHSPPLEETAVSMGRGLSPARSSPPASKGKNVTSNKTSASGPPVSAGAQQFAVAEHDVPGSNKPEEKMKLNPENVDKGLAQLVLTLVELLRQLLERQAVRRIDSDTLTDVEVERMGETFIRLEEKIRELKNIFGLSDEELNINLGPLGDLM